MIQEWGEEDILNCALQMIPLFELSSNGLLPEELKNALLEVNRLYKKTSGRDIQSRQIVALIIHNWESGLYK